MAREKDIILVFGITDIPCIGTLKKIEMDPYINTMDKNHPDQTNMCIGTHIQKQKCFIKSLEAFFSKSLTNEAYCIAKNR